MGGGFSGCPGFGCFDFGNPRSGWVVMPNVQIRVVTNIIYDSQIWVVKYESYYASYSQRLLDILTYLPQIWVVHTVEKPKAWTLTGLLSTSVKTREITDAFRSSAPSSAYRV